MLVGGLDHNVVCAALNDTGRGYQRQLCLLLQLGNGQRTAVAHGGLDLCQGNGYVILEAACIRHVGVDTLFKRELLIAAKVISLPVARTGRAFTPVFLVVGAADADLVGGAFVKARKVSAKHNEIRTHCQRKRNVVIVNDATVGAYGNVNTGLFEVSVSLGTNVDERSCLSATDSFLFSCDTNDKVNQNQVDRQSVTKNNMDESLEKANRYLLIQETELIDDYIEPMIKSSVSKKDLDKIETFKTN